MNRPCRKLASPVAFCALIAVVRQWFQAMFLLSQSKNNISALELKRQLGVGYTTAWRTEHKLMQVISEQESGRILSGNVVMDDAYLEGEHRGKDGHCSTDISCFAWISILLGNFKTALSGTYHAFDFKKYAHRYLAEYQYRFNRRHDLKTILSRLFRAAMTTGPRPEAWLRLAETSRKSRKNSRRSRLTGD